MANSIQKDSTSTFIDNMSLPLHRWYRYSAGFSAEWVESMIHEYLASSQLSKDAVTVMDPFAGSGTTLLVCDKMGISSIGYEGHPFVYKVAKAKLSWPADTDLFIREADKILDCAKHLKTKMYTYPDIVYKSYDIDNLKKINYLRKALEINKDDTDEYLLAWMNFISILRSASHAGTATWQYVLPNKTKARVADAYEAFQKQTDIMCGDMQYMQAHSHESKANLLFQDAREDSDVPADSVDLIITSPPYANNYDYADATRLELSVLGEIKGWGDLQKKIRPNLVRSCSQMVSRERKDTYEFLKSPLLKPIYEEILDVCRQLDAEKELHGGKKNYHTMIALYFLDLAKIWKNLRRVCKDGSLTCFVIGDSAPYGIYVPVDEWLGRLAISAGFKEYWFEKTRDRNVKWKNRKHSVPLKEGRLWVRG
ncbi:hypothetical protein GCM10008910_14000 [Faecalicatena orotica]|uniref:site-specific DNA-methyltransferase (cytosine-N(4)-specific) n=1 Tax=Faecalicatena orotica TaxID=1544 RepID=A0A2Y9BEB2_9FIRM|nr:DNA methyltransferase [Faecalicatena orotica]PWJ31445.1 DNA methylase [Faecalicatena orotica]SSA54652.1 DNA methylase [Faecalicatena orotica]